MFDLEIKINKLMKMKVGDYMSIVMEDIPYELHTMVEIVGIENFEELSKFYGGTTVYIPVHRKIIIGERNREIVRTYNGRNIETLRRKYGLTNQQIKRILAENNALN